MFEKVVWISTYMLVGTAKECESVGQAGSDHAELVEQVVNDLVAAVSGKEGITFPAGTMERLAAYTDVVTNFPCAVKAFEWRNQYFFDLGDEACPIHNELLRECAEKVFLSFELPSIGTKEGSDVTLAKQFPSLSQPFSRAPILGLYFGASWCGDCDAATPALAKVIASQKKDEELVHVVYVSSDKSAEEMAAYKPEQFSEVPWEAEEERSNIKRFFRTWPGKERESLGMSRTDRKNQIPTLILLDAQTGSILTESGMEQVESMESAESVLKEWKSML